MEIERRDAAIGSAQEPMNHIENARLRYMAGTRQWMRLLAYCSDKRTTFQRGAGGLNACEVPADMHLICIRAITVALQLTDH